ncbi:MAG: trypsin-like peptidase domain-containing protein [Enhydrobacter sp.]|nr:MAG: trypsin-like peptidase domain-containing protein [Enhydrobacter sp.]
MLFIPASNYFLPTCAGQKGIARLRCDDGRYLLADWTATSCTSGHGEGDDNRGVRFEFAFGMSEQEVMAKLGQHREEAASKPDLPIYRPRQVRKEKGFSVDTGFFVTSDGYLMTNHHVVDGSTRISVPIGGIEHTAQSVHNDPAHDLALLKIEGRFAALPIGSSSTVVRADEVFTLGYPLITL